MGTFQGFADDRASFFKKLAKNNNRDWFLAHKQEFETGYNEPMKHLLAQVRAKIDGAYAHSDLDEPKVFRIFRDVRFSKDKSPYKTHLGGFLPMVRRGKKVTDMPMALYFHYGATGTFAAAGHHMMEPESLERFRRAVAHEQKGAELEAILKKLGKKGYVAESYDALKRVPKGYDADHPRAALLKRKGLTVAFPPLPKGILAKPALVGWLSDACKKAAPLVEWLVFATA